MVNKFIFIDRLGKNAEVKTMQNKKALHIRRVAPDGGQIPVRFLSILAGNMKRSDQSRLCSACATE
jgi:hypothetical protein